MVMLAKQPRQTLVYRSREGLVSPPAEHILFGVSMGIVMELGDAQLGLPFVTRPLNPEELRTAEEVMLASTSICMQPVVRRDGTGDRQSLAGGIFR